MLQPPMQPKAVLPDWKESGRENPIVERVEVNTVEEWVEGVSAITRPDKVVYCNGSREEYEKLIQERVSDGSLIKLNQEKFPGGYLSRSDPKERLSSWREKPSDTVIEKSLLT